MAKAKAPSPYAPAKSDAYTGLLIISLLALIAGCTFLYLDWSQYSKTKPPLPGTVSTGRPAGGQPGAGGAQGGQPAGAQGQMGGAMGQMGGGMMGQMGGGAMGQMGNK